jgi:phosphoglucomutase
MEAETLEVLRTRLLAQYDETGAQAWRNVTLWREGGQQFVPADALDDFLSNAPLDLVHDSFWQDIPFGTGGVRGTVGFGPNRINPTVVARTIQAHCDYVNRFFEEDPDFTYERRIVIANDVRVFLDIAGNLTFLKENPYHAENEMYGVTSRRLAYLAAGVYAANGFLVYLTEPEGDAFLTTPELSFLIRELNAAGGINLSASHNPPDDNGVKIYDENGGQYLPPYDQQLTDMARDVQEVRHLPYPEALAAGLVSDVPADTLRAYHEMYRTRAIQRGLESRHGTRIVFTPLSGCAGRTVAQSLRSLGYTVELPESGGQPDGTFQSIPLHAPNPEVPESTEPARRTAPDDVGLVLACDPDADRLGAEVRHRGAWVHLSGNQIATILAYFLFLDETGPRIRGGVYQNVVTTLATRAIAERAGCAPIHDDLLVGFKYVGKAVQDLAGRLGPGADDTALLAFAAEESHGFLDTPRLRDKDATPGALCLASLHERLSQEGRTLIDYLESVYRDVGEFGDRGRSIVIHGSEGFREIRRVMTALRERGPRLTTFGGVEVRRFVDYWDTSQGGEITSETERAARNIVVLWCDGGKITFRPSGTEPKLKLYVQTSGPAAEGGAQASADRLAAAVYQEVLGILDKDLRPAFADLPDVVPLEAKRELQRIVDVDLRHVVSGGRHDADQLAEWLQPRIKEVIPGKAPWNVAEPVVIAAVADWAPDEASLVQRAFTAIRK